MTKETIEFKARVRHTGTHSLGLTIPKEDRKKFIHGKTYKFESDGLVVSDEE